ncbi:pescadillo [Thecamonas trahens ATCC 50062]|uniref:Pescadillo homolog n=1 Tax=Thecamonas trahens ATCC 50062 TaxID=461836 RepID=A0A0L0DQW3_THETB|nr:pescadillo [Thecamonas trahens ATCC 50062]KNC54689.1 pescadillo [Thecamonas trahens ATCC 50062]|eukprot:XP_013761591.1 pescadillo [Thecamonas trahens ATCC 50062]
MAPKLRNKKGDTFARKYFTRTKAMRKLGLSVGNFRRLCILKGVFPRAPKGSGSSSQVYYLAKDIKFLAHDPLLQSFQKEHRHFKQMKSALGVRDFKKLNELVARRPSISVSHIIRERYPTFVDAIRDLDDALSLMFLFASVERLHYRYQPALLSSIEFSTLHFLNYVVKTSSLKKVFISIKGIYYQAAIMGQNVTWIVPHRAKVDTELIVNHTILHSFVQFYDTLLKFVNFKLYATKEMPYPPEVSETLRAGDAMLDIFNVEAAAADDGGMSPAENAVSEEAAASEAPITDDDMRSRIDSLRATIESRAEEESALVAATGGKDDENELDEFEEDDEDEEARVKRLAARQAKKARQRKKCLFAGLNIWLNRETPVDSLQFVVKALKGEVAWETHPAPAFALDSPRITHHIIDRPMAGKTIAGRVYVQPQWVYDSVNAGFLLPTEWYAPGAALPPHLSPFEEYAEGDHVPDQYKVITDLKNELFASEEVKAKLAAKAKAKALEEARATGILSLDDAQREQVYSEELLAEQLGIPYTRWAKMSEEEREAVVKNAAEPIGPSHSDDDAAPAGDKTKAKRKRVSKQQTRSVDDNLDTIMLSKNKRRKYNSVINKRESRKRKADMLASRKAALEAKANK